MVLVDRCAGSERQGLPCVSSALCDAHCSGTWVPAPPWDLGSPGLGDTLREV